MSPTSKHGKRKEKRWGSLSDNNLLLAIVGLTLLVMVLGGLILVLKLRQPAPSSIANRDLSVWLNAVKQDDSDPWNHNGLALAYAKAGRTDDARNEFERALELDRQNWLANYQLALIVKDEDPKKAEKLLVLSGKTTPLSQKVGPYTALGELRFEMGDFKDAKDAFVQAVADMRDVVAARVGLGRSYASLGDTRKAIDQMEGGLQLDPGNPDLEAEIKAMKRGDWKPDQVMNGTWSAEAQPTPSEGA